MDKENELGKWLVGNAVNNRSMCKDPQCLHGEEEERKISKGELRIGRRIPSPYDPNSVQILWYHAKCMFSMQTRSRKTTEVIETEDQLDNFNELQMDEQCYIKDMIQGNVDLRARSFTPGKRRSETGNAPGETPGTGKKPKTGPKTRDFGRILFL